MCAMQMVLVWVRITKLFMPAGNGAKVYGIERAMYDILRPHNQVDFQVLTDAFKQYVVRRDKNLLVLSEYAKRWRLKEA